MSEFEDANVDKDILSQIFGDDIADDKDDEKKDDSLFADSSAGDNEDEETAEAVSVTEEEVSAEDILKDFLVERGEDVQKIMMFDLTYEKQMENAKREWFNDGVEEGRAEGYSSGIAEGRASGIAEGRAEGAVHHLVASVVKKVQKNKTLEQIADELEESVEDIQLIYDIVKKHAPEYDVDAITAEVLEVQEKYE